MTKSILIKKYNGAGELTVSVPGSKSITNRALLLAALASGRCLLKGVLFSDDTRAMMDCLVALGFTLEADEGAAELTLVGGGGQIPRKQAHINVQSAGTAARFLTAFLAFGGGDYTICASEQMKRRPMAPLISILRSLGAQIECLEAEGHLPLRITNGALSFSEPPLVTVDTGLSSQFASALLLVGAMCRPGLKIRLCGARAQGAYIGISLKMMADFGIRHEQAGNDYLVSFTDSCGVSEYHIEPDISSACYFYAMAPLLGIDVCVRGVHADMVQGDLAFLDLLEQMGAGREETTEGIRMLGRGMDGYPGLDVDMRGFSDQTMTLAVLAAFARTETRIRGIGHIRHQESDRMAAICTELGRIGATCDIIGDGEGLSIEPLHGGMGDVQVEIETYDDHRMAMAFSLVGLKTGNISIKNPACCAKTFANFFKVIEGLT